MKLRIYSLIAGALIESHEIIVEANWLAEYDIEGIKLRTAAF